MKLPPELITAALVGVERAGLPAAGSLPPALAGLYRGLDGRPPEEALLLLAGATALHNAAGRLPDRAADGDGGEWRPPAYRPEGDRPQCSPEAARFLDRMLNRQDTAHLPEFLALLDEAGQRAPDELLPLILEKGAKIPRQRPMLLPALGERGRWLASLNPDWHYAVVDSADAGSLRRAWATDVAGRPALARAMRALDPAAARRLIESTWRAEPDATRREMMVVLEQGLSIDDEPFLERALDDRDALTRRKAADLLATLPGSRLVARVTAVAGDILAFDGGGGLAPSWSGVITEAMVRDGIARPNALAGKSGVTRPNAPHTAADWSRLIVQTVGIIPLDHWTARFEMEPEGLIAAAQAGKWPRTMLSAFAAAAIRQRNRRWADALLTADGYSERTGALLAALEPQDCYDRLAERLAAGDEAAVIVFLRRWPHAWDEATGRRLIDFIGRMSAVDPETRLSPTLRFLLRQFAQRCPPSLLDYATETIGRREVTPLWEVSLRQMLAVLAARWEMRAVVGSRGAEEQGSRGAEEQRRLGA